MAKVKESVVSEVSESGSGTAEVAMGSLPEAKEKVTSLTKAATNPKLIFNSYDAEITKGNQNESGGWMHAPAYLELFKAAVDRLAQVSRERGTTVRRVKHVRAALEEGSKKIWIFPTEQRDPDAIPVNYYRRKATINLITLLGQAKLTVETGYRERYALEFAPANCPVGPALEINMGRMLEHRPETRRFKSGGAPVDEEPASDTQA